MRVMMAGVLASLVAVLAGCANKKEAVTVATPSEQYVTKVMECLDHTERILSDMTAPADSAAKRWAAGGTVYVTDDETIKRTGEEAVKMIPGAGVSYPMSEDWGGFVAEACDRAGGFRHMKPVPVNLQVTANDVVLAGTAELHPEEQLAQLTTLKDAGALIIVFGSKNAKVASIADFVIDNGLDAGVVPVMTASGDSLLGPVGPMANVINLWTFSAELIGAMNRLGKMPTLWQSMFVPGAAARNTAIETMEFDTAAKIQPVEAGTLGRQYVTAAKSCLDSIKTTELARFEQAGTVCSDALKSGHKVVAGIIGHFMVAQTRMPGYPALFTVVANEYGRGSLEGKLGAGDVFLHVGYSYNPVDELSFAREVGAKSFAVFTAGPTTVGEGEPVPPDTTQVDVYINPFWKHGDAVVEVPGYDVKVMPVSGVVMITCYWMIIGETVKRMGK